MSFTKFNKPSKPRGRRGGERSLRPAALSAGFTATHFLSGVLLPLFLMGGVVFGYFGVRPKYQDVREQKDSLKNKKTELQDKQQKLLSIEDLLKEVRNKNKELQKVDEALPPSPEVPELLANLESLAQISGLLLSNIQLTLLQEQASGQEAASGGPKTNALVIIEVNLVARGTYANLKTFLLNAERNLRLLDIQNLTLGQVDEETGAQDFSLKLKTYYQKL